MKNIIQYQTKTYKKVINHNQRTHNHIFTLLVIPLFSFLFFGCSSYFMGERIYEPPDLPKNELASIQIDTKGLWIQRYDLIALSINGKSAFRKKIIEINNFSIDDVLVVPGKHNLSLSLLTRIYHEGISKEHQTVSNYTIDVKAGSTYLLKGEYADDSGEEVNFELVDSDTDQVVSKYITTRESTYKIEDSGTESIQIESTIEF